MSEQARATKPAVAGAEAGPAPASTVSPAAPAALRVPTADDRQAAFRASVARRNETGLPDGLKAGIESLSGFSMDDVRVHYGSAKPARLGALAYAQGSEIHVAPGEERHLPHEAWHVVQQKQGRVRATTQLKGVGVNDAPHLEREADAMGAAAMKPAGSLDALRAAAPRGGGVVQRVLAAQIVTDEHEEKVQDVHIADRLKGLFGGKMGAHTTAWLVYQDMVRRAVVGRPVEQAWQGLRDLCHQATSLPGYALTPANDTHARRYREARQKLEATLSVDFAKVPEVHRAAVLGKAVVEFLEFRELVPLSVIKLASKNRDESHYAAELRGQTSGNPYEAVTELQDAASVGIGLTDSADPGMTSIGVPAGRPAAQILVMFARQHWQSIVTAYPDAVRAQGPNGWRKLMPAMRQTVLEAIAKAELETNKEIARQRKIQTKIGIEHEESAECEKLIQAAEAAKAKLAALRAEVAKETKDEQEAAPQPESSAASAAASSTPSLQIPHSVSGLDGAGPGSLSLVPFSSSPSTPASSSSSPSVSSSSAAASSSASTTERAYHAVRVAFEGDKIVKVAVGGRPPSPFSGTMGAHTVPWMSLVGDLEDALLDRTVDEAVETLIGDVSDECTKGSRWLEANPEGSVDPRGRAAIAAAVEKLDRALDFLVGGIPGSNALQIGIAAVLQARYVAPGAAVDKAGTGGRFEGGSDKILKQFEADGKIPGPTKRFSGEKRLIRALASMLDVDVETKTLLENVAGLQKRYPKAFAAVMNTHDVTSEVAKQYAELCEAVSDEDY